MSGKTRAEVEAAATAGATHEGLVGELLALACRLAVEAGDLAAAGARRDGVATRTKSTETDLVTAHDGAAEQVVVDGLAADRPDDAIVGEEGTDRAGTSGLSWYVDPIDGTTNFVYGLTHWSTSIAVGDASGMLAGAVYLPVTGELFAAGRGMGATCNGEAIACRPTTDLGMALVATGFSYAPVRRRRQAAIVTAIIGDVRDIRRSGSAAVDLCHVAAGRVDAYYEEHLNIWDMAAGLLIAQEAGCRSGDFAGHPPVPEQLLVTAPALFDDLARALSVAAMEAHPPPDRA